MSLGLFFKKAPRESWRICLIQRQNLCYFRYLA